MENNIPSATHQEKAKKMKNFVVGRLQSAF